MIDAISDAGHAHRGALAIIEKRSRAECRTARRLAL
jgi:hypothetical protein